ncbi:hypothetical protein ABT023_04055 [Micromonospora sp. NPDC002296]|uniref:hypothetical protein n=1 Tax=Micromonospora sp. NPDC002296 TaxID=3154271 RepID=UPI00331F8161
MVGGDVVDRLRGGGLAALAVLVVAAGAGWWRAVAPAVGSPVGPAVAAGADERARDPGDGTGRTGSGATSGDLGRVPPEEAPLVITVDPGGRVTSGIVAIDPATGRAIERYDAGTGYGEGPDGGLGGVTGTVWQTRLALRPGQPTQRRAVEATTGAHLVQYRCVGPGQLLLVADRSGHRDIRRATCDGSLTTTWLSRGNGPIRIELAAAARGIAPIVVDARVVALAFWRVNGQEPRRARSAR